MIVTRFNYPLEKEAVKKLDLVIDRLINNQDALIIFEGSEGEGKTTFCTACCYYIAEKTNREFSDKNLYFNVEPMIEKAQNTEKGIFVWDEPALQALSTDWGSRAVKNITRLLMMARKKNHLWVINMTKFHKFNEWVVVDRTHCFFHVYSRDETQRGRFTYIPKKKLEALWRDFRFKKIRNYKKHSSKKCRGTFPDILNPKYKNNVLSHFNIVDYEKRKDYAIKEIGKLDIKTKEIPQPIRKKVSIEVVTKIVGGLPIKNREELCKCLEITSKTLYNWLNPKKTEQKQEIRTDYY